MVHAPAILGVLASGGDLAPLGLEGAAPVGTGGQFDWDRWAASGLAAAALMLAAAALLRILDRRRRPPAERAFDVLSRRMKLRPRKAAVVRRLAARAGMPPVALLISEHAFARASQRVGDGAAGERAGGLGPSRDQVEDVRRALFGQSSTKDSVRLRRSA